MKLISTIATAAVLLASAATLNVNVAYAESNFGGFQIQKIAQFKNKNSSPRRGASSSFGANIGGKGQVCCTHYNHEDGYEGCATFQGNSCPLYARFTPPPDDY